MISVEQALDRVLGSIDVWITKKARFWSALGQVLTEDIYSNINVPPRDNSALDGYAVRSADIKGASQKSPVFCVS
jgi:molybdopterin molybdotransferase